MTTYPTEFMPGVEGAPMDHMELPRRTDLFEWLRLLDSLTKPTALIERALTEIDSIQGGMRQPCKAAAVGTNMLGMLATLALRMRGAEVVTFGRVPQPLLSPNRVKGIPGWKHIWMSPALAQLPLVEEIGARYASALELSGNGAAHRFGPFDVIILGSAEPSLMPGLTRGLAKAGALLDLAVGEAAIETWTATSTSGFLERRRTTFQLGEDDRVYIERATRNLAMADALYPGWLRRLLQSFDAPRCAGPWSAVLES